MFDKAVLLASQAHLGQRDKGGKAYILHPMRIAMRLRTDDEELMCIAILHDAVEDSDLTFEDLEREGFSSRVVNALRLLTHKEGQSYSEYISDMQHNKDALRVKREDLRDNSDITRLKGLRGKDFERMKKYSTAFVTINEYLEKFDC